MSRPKITAADIRAMKSRGQPVGALTVYDFPMTQLLDEAEVPLLLVGDSLGMVLLGYPDTTYVTMADMEHHVRAAARAGPRALLAADLPYHGYQNAQEALANAQRLIAAGAEAVKAEGGQTIAAQVAAIVKAGIPFLGHLGMLPQSIREEGSYKIKGKSVAEHQALLSDAKLLSDLGAFAIVLELVTPPVAREISEAIPIPTIGIGSGPNCDGQILVTTDLIGLSPRFIPKHVKQRLDLAPQIREFVRTWNKQLPIRKPASSGA